MEEHWQVNLFIIWLGQQPVNAYCATDSGEKIVVRVKVRHSQAVKIAELQLRLSILDKRRYLEIEIL